MSIPSPAFLDVSPDEEGMKLLRFLERRLAETVPKAALHKWIRTGQVRVNKGRAKPFATLAAGDQVRVPPFAGLRETRCDAAGPVTDPAVSFFEPDLGPGIRVVFKNPALLVLAKESGPPCQPGSGHEDAVSARLREAFAASPYIPAPAHRIDRHTSGLLLAGLSHKVQERLHALFASGGIEKFYLAWVCGEWKERAPVILEDRLAKRRLPDGGEGMAALPGGRTLPLRGAALAAESGLALSAAMPVCATPAGVLQERLPATLLLLRLFTGRTHQLRVQLASRGCPVLGDGRYAGPRFSPMLLHAFALSLPADILTAAASDATPNDCPHRREFSVLPSWPQACMPDAAALAAARREMDAALVGRVNF